MDNGWQHWFAVSFLLYQQSSPYSHKTTPSQNRVSRLRPGSVSDPKVVVELLPAPPTPLVPLRAARAPHLMRVELKHLWLAFYCTSGQGRIRAKQSHLTSE